MPGLLTLHTDLKSLKYGHDTPGGGDSGQPYIKTDINTVDRGINKLRLTKFDDGLIRGGIIGAINSSVVDTLRIGKFLTDFPKGPLFIVKQVGLQLTNPRIESTTQKTNKPTSGQGFLSNAINFVSNTVNKVENAVGPTRIYNLGINTLAQVPINALGGHIVRHGFLPNNDDSKYYENVIKVKNFKNNSSRLLDLTNNFNLGPWGANKPGLNKKEQGMMNKLKGLASASPYGAIAFGALNAVLNLNKETEVDSYLGGASSIYGIGVTTIRRFSDTEDKDKIDFARAQSIALAGKTRDDKDQPTEVKYLDRFLGASNYASSSLGRFYFVKNQSPISNDDNYIPVNLSDRRASVDDLSSTTHDKTGQLNVNDISRFRWGAPSSYYVSSIGPSGSIADAFVGLNSLNTPNKVKEYSGAADIQAVSKIVDQLSVNDQTYSPNIGIYAQLFNGQLNGDRLPKSKLNPVYTNYYGDAPIQISAAGVKGWDTLTREKRVGSGRRDSLSLTPLFDDVAGSIGDTPGGVKNKGLLKIPNTNVQTINDLVKFRIQAINTDSNFSNGSTGTATWMIFRAYISDMSDNVDASWDGVKYAGRGDQFYIYSGFTRKMSVSFKVAALSRQEMEPMYQKLNFLMSNLMPDYGGPNKVLMRGPMMRMTIGNWIDGQLCILNSLSYKPLAESPWEIGLNDEEMILPHIVEVTLNFTPIGSQTRDKNELPRKSDCVSNIAQNWNGAHKGEREYIVPCPVEEPVVPPDPTPLPVTPDPIPVAPPPPLPPPVIPPATSDFTGTGQGQAGNTGKEHKFGTKQQEDAYIRATYGGGPVQHSYPDNSKNPYLNPPSQPTITKPFGF